MIMPDGQDATT